MVVPTYELADKVRVKFSREIAKSSQNLRLLVSHANLLDNLILRLAQQERNLWLTEVIECHTQGTNVVKLCSLEEKKS
jgi:hypothetical protein